jgi:hypothetical protein
MDIRAAFEQQSIDGQRSAERAIFIGVRALADDAGEQLFMDSSGVVHVDRSEWLRPPRYTFERHSEHV